MMFIIDLIATYPIPCLIGAIWIVVIVNKYSGTTARYDAETWQSRDELMKRNKTVMQHKTGEEFKSKRTRGGFQNESDSWFVSGQVKKEKKK